MSLIACILNHDVPFLIADLLFSSTEGTKGMLLPTNNFDIAEFLPTDMQYRPHSLYQKLYIIKKNVCVALAGNSIEMENFLSEFKLRCNYYEEVKEDHIKEFLNEYQLETEFKNSAFFITLIEHRENNSVYVGLFNYPANSAWGSIENDIYGKVYACGSGKSGFLNFLKQEAVFTSTFAKGEMANAIQAKFILIARLLALEKITLYTIKTYWGAGFETVYYNGSSFEKLDKIAYVVNQGQFNTEGDIGLPIPRSILYYKYHGNILTITTIEIIKAQRIDFENTIKITSKTNEIEIKQYKIGSIEKNDIHEELITDNLSFHTHDVAMGYALLTPSGGTFNPAFYSREANISVAYNDNDGVEIRLSLELNNKIRVEAKKVFPNL